MKNGSKAALGWIAALLFVLVAGLAVASRFGVWG
jgi:hypothetical protein